MIARETAAPRDSGGYPSSAKPLLILAIEAKTPPGLSDGVSR